MQVTLHAVFDNYQELAKFADLLAKSDLSVKASNQTLPTVVSKDKPPTTNQKLAAKAEAEATKQEAAPKEAENQDPLQYPEYIAMKEAVFLVNRKLGRKATEDILKKFGGEKNGKLSVGPHIPKKHFAAIIAEANEVLK